MIPQVRIKEAVQFLEIAIKAKQPCLIVGSPGIGKSDMVDQVRRNLGYDLILSHPAVSDPIDAKGFPFAVTIDGHTTADFIPYGDLRFAMETTRPTIWFLDDFGQAPPAVQAAYMQLLLAREVNGKRISDSITFLAATNRRQDKSGVTGILEAVKSRFALIFELTAHIDDFCDWAYRNHIYPTIPAYLRFDSRQLCNFQPNNDMEQSPSPRTWAKLSAILSNTPQAIRTNKLLTSKLVSSAIGEAASTPFLAFESLFGELPNIDKLIQHPDTFIPPERQDVLYAICATLAQRTTLDNIANIVELSERIKPQFAAVLMADARSVCPDIEFTDAFSRYSERATRAYIA